MENKEKQFYNHYIAIDWSISGVAIAAMRTNSKRVEVKEFGSDLKEVKEYIESKKGRKILTIEETSGTHWLYVELKESVDRILICDPYRNSLLSEGPKTDKIDARKLCTLLRNGMLKEVYHSTDESYKIRKLVSSYDDLVKAGVRVKNQRSAIYRAEGLNHKTDEAKRNDEIFNFIEAQQQKSIMLYKEEKKKYEALFNSLSKEKQTIQDLLEVSGVGLISAVMIYSTVIDASRFESKYKYWSYCGLVYHQKESGNRNYGRRKPRYSRRLKGVYKTAALGALNGNNDIREYYEYLLSRGYTYRDARNQIARYIAKVTYSIMRNGTKYRAYQWQEKIAA